MIKLNHFIHGFYVKGTYDPYFHFFDNEAFGGIFHWDKVVTPSGYDITDLLLDDDGYPSNYYWEIIEMVDKWCRDNYMRCYA